MAFGIKAIKCSKVHALLTHGNSLLGCIGVLGKLACMCSTCCALAVPWPCSGPAEGMHAAAPCPSARLLALPALCCTPVSRQHVEFLQLHANAGMHAHLPAGTWKACGAAVFQLGIKCSHLSDAGELISLLQKRCCSSEFPLCLQVADGVISVLCHLRHRKLRWLSWRMRFSEQH